MLLYDAMDPIQPCRSMRIRRRADCSVCGQGTQPLGDGDGGQSAQTGGALSAPVGANADCRSVQLEVSATELDRRLRQGIPTVLIDVRQSAHFAVAHLSAANN